MKAGDNTLLVAENVGAYFVRATALDYGIRIVAETDEGKVRRAFYLRRVASSDFAIEIVFTKYEEYKHFNDWLMGWARLAMTGGSSNIRVLMPSHELDRYAILKTGITYGDQTGRITHRMRLQFGGGREPGEIQTSQVVDPTQDLIHGQYYYPSGTQLSGTAIGEDRFYQSPIALPSPQWEEWRRDIMDNPEDWRRRFLRTPF